MKFFLFECFNIIIIVISILFFALILFLFSLNKEEEISDEVSVNSASSTQSKEKRKNYLTKMNTLINSFMSERLPELNLKKYLKMQNEYRNQFKKRIIQNFNTLSRRKSVHKTKKVTFQENYEEKEFII